MSENTATYILCKHPDLSYSLKNGDGDDFSNWLFLWEYCRKKLNLRSCQPGTVTQFQGIRFIRTETQEARDE
jgi:hypothetical protein